MNANVGRSRYAPHSAMYGLTVDPAFFGGRNYDNGSSTAPSKMLNASSHRRVATSQRGVATSQRGIAPSQRGIAPSQQEVTLPLQGFALRQRAAALDFLGEVQSGPVQSGPVQSGPVQSGPVQSGPAQRSPIQRNPNLSGTPATAVFSSLYRANPFPTENMAVAGRFSAVDGGDRNLQTLAAQFNCEGAALHDLQNSHLFDGLSALEEKALLGTGVSFANYAESDSSGNSERNEYNKAGGSEENGSPRFLAHPSYRQQLRPHNRVEEYFRDHCDAIPRQLVDSAARITPKERATVSPVSASNVRAILGQKLHSTSLQPTSSSFMDQNIHPHLATRERVANSPCSDSSTTSSSLENTSIYRMYTHCLKGGDGGSSNISSLDKFIARRNSHMRDDAPIIINAEQEDAKGTGKTEGLFSFMELPLKSEGNVSLKSMKHVITEYAAPFVHGDPTSLAESDESGSSYGSQQPCKIKLRQSQSSLDDGDHFDSRVGDDFGNSESLSLLQQEDEDAVFNLGASKTDQCNKRSEYGRFLGFNNSTLDKPSPTVPTAAKREYFVAEFRQKYDGVLLKKDDRAYPLRKLPLTSTTTSAPITCVGGTSPINSIDEDDSINRNDSFGADAAPVELLRSGSGANSEGPEENKAMSAHLPSSPRSPSPSSPSSYPTQQQQQQQQQHFSGPDDDTTAVVSERFSTVEDTSKNYVTNQVDAASFSPGVSESASPIRQGLNLKSRVLAGERKLPPLHSKFYSRSRCRQRVSSLMTSSSSAAMIKKSLRRRCNLGGNKKNKHDEVKVNGSQVMGLSQSTVLPQSTVLQYEKRRSLDFAPVQLVGLHNRTGKYEGNTPKKKTTRDVELQSMCDGCHVLSHGSCYEIGCVGDMAPPPPSENLHLVGTSEEKTSALGHHWEKEEPKRFSRSVITTTWLQILGREGSFVVYSPGNGDAIADIWDRIEQEHHEALIIKKPQKRHCICLLALDRVDSPVDAPVNSVIREGSSFIPVNTVSGKVFSVDAARARFLSMRSIIRQVILVSFVIYTVAKFVLAGVVVCSSAAVPAAAIAAAATTRRNCLIITSVTITMISVEIFHFLVIRPSLLKFASALEEAVIRNIDRECMIPYIEERLSHAAAAIAVRLNENAQSLEWDLTGFRNDFKPGGKCTCPNFTACFEQECCRIMSLKTPSPHCYVPFLRPLLGGKNEENACNIKYNFSRVATSNAFLVAAFSLLWYIILWAVVAVLLLLAGVHTSLYTPETAATICAICCVLAVICSNRALKFPIRISMRDLRTKIAMSLSMMISIVEVELRRLEMINIPSQSKTVYAELNFDNCRYKIEASLDYKKNESCSIQIIQTSIDDVTCPPTSITVNLRNQPDGLRAGHG